MRPFLLAFASLTLFACSGGGSGTSTTPGTPAAVNSVIVTPSTNSVFSGGTAQLSALARDASGNTLSGRSVNWSTSAANIATVSSDGLVTAIAAGTATITAASEGKSGTASVTVTAAVSTVTVTSGFLLLAPGARTLVVGTPRDASNNALSGRAISYSSSAPTVASVSSTGLVIALAVGTVTITATSENKVGIIALNISASAITPFLQRPFVAEYLVANPMDHDTPEEFIDNNGRFVTTSGESAYAFDGHAGYDFSMPVGVPIFAAAAGTVNSAGATTFFCPPLNKDVTQLAVQIQHIVAGNPEYWTYYAHFSRVDVTNGQVVTAGQQIGLSGNTGCTTAPHTHFQVDRIAGTNNGQLAIVDPYGWTGATADPWEVNPKGAKSVNLWLPGQAPQALLGLDENTIAINSTAVTATPKPVVLSAIRFQGTHDELAPNNEYVEIRIDPNVYTAPTYLMTGHTIKNNAGDVFTFPAGFTIAQGQTVRLNVGSGSATATNLFWGKPAGIFVNSGDCAQLFVPTKGFYLLGWAVTCK